MKRVCTRCGLEYDAPKWHIKANHYRCNPCSRLYQRKWRKKRREDEKPASGRKMPLSYFKKYGKKYYAKLEVKRKRAENMRIRRLNKNEVVKLKARDLVNKGLKKGLLVKLPCEKCGSKHSQAHHLDYSKPLQVIWLCRKHHSQEHKKGANTKIIYK